MENKREKEERKENIKTQETDGRRAAGRMRLNYSMWEQMGYGRICETSMEKIKKAAKEGLFENLEKREDKQQILGEPERLEGYLENYGAACQCYYLYRTLHEKTGHDTKTAVLLGDYFFGEFSHYLIPIDSPKLIEIFSGRLQRETGQAVPESEKRPDAKKAAGADCQTEYRNLEEYTAFIKRIPEQFVEELV